MCSLGVDSAASIYFEAGNAIIFYTISELNTESYNSLHLFTNDDAIIFNNNTAQYLGAVVILTTSGFFPLDSTYLVCTPGGKIAIRTSYCKDVSSSSAEFKLLICFYAPLYEGLTFTGLAAAVSSVVIDNISYDAVPYSSLPSVTDSIPINATNPSRSNISELTLADTTISDTDDLLNYTYRLELSEAIKIRVLATVTEN